MKKYRSRKHLEEGRRRRRRVAILVTVALLCLAAAAFFITRLEAFRITDVVVEGTETIDPNTIKKELFFMVDESRFLLFANQASFIFPQSHAEKTLLAKMSRLESIRITIDGRILRAQIEEKSPYLVLCAFPEEAKENCFVFDETGEVFSRYVPELQEGFPRLPVIVHQYEEPFLLSTRPFSESIFDFIKNIIAVYKDASLPFAYGVLANETIDMYAINKKSHVRFIVTRPLEDQLQALTTTVASPERIAPQLNQHEYIDVRFDDRVYLKKMTAEDAPQEEVSTVEESTTEIGE